MPDWGSWSLDWVVLSINIVPVPVLTPPPLYRKPQPSNFFCPSRHWRTYQDLPGSHKSHVSPICSIFLTLTLTFNRTANWHLFIPSYAIQVIYQITLVHDSDLLEPIPFIPWTVVVWSDKTFTWRFCFFTNVFKPNFAGKSSNELICRFCSLWLRQLPVLDWLHIAHQAVLHVSILTAMMTEHFVISL